MIESRFWKEDLLTYAKKFSPVENPPRWTEKLHVNFEKEVTIAFFMVRKLFETHKVSSISRNLRVDIYRHPCIASHINNFNYWQIDELYDLDNEELVHKNITFTCNQLIHGGATHAYRNPDRNWGGIYTCSDFERARYIYRIPLQEIIKVLKTVSTDYPGKFSWIWFEEKQDYLVSTD